MKRRHDSYFLRSFLLLTAFFMAAWAAVGTIYVKGVRSQQLDRIAAECSNEAVRIAGELDGRMVKIRNLLENVSNIPWIKKLSTSSEIFLRDFTVLERMECTSELARLSYAEPSIVHTALYIRTQNRVLSPKGWFTVEEYRASIRDLPGVELDEILRLAEEKHSFDSFPNLPYNIDAGNHIVIIHSMADVAHPLASLIVILDRQRFGEDVERLSSSRIERVEIVTDAGQVLLTVKKTASTAGEDGTSPVSINSEVVGVRYEITYPPLEEMAGEYGAIGLSAVLKLLAGSLLAVLVSYLISLFIIRPVKRLVRRISALLDNGESSSVMKLEQIEESFFRLCEKERTLQRDLRQVSNAARKYILWSYVKI